MSFLLEMVAEALSREDPLEVYTDSIMLQELVVLALAEAADDERHLHKILHFNIFAPFK